MKKYSIISNKKRNELIERVVKNGESVSRVSKQLRMKLPSAKSIIRTFKKSGKIFDKKRVIPRKLGTKRIEMSETEHQSQIASISEQKIVQKEVKEEPKEQVVQKGQQKKNIETKQIFPRVQSSFKICPDMSEYAREYYAEMYLRQEINYYHNLLTLCRSQGLLNSQI